jgi:hypothetical protein
VAEVALVIAVVLVPLAVGAAAAFFARPWWWGALLAIIVFLIAAIAPEPEAGESRVAAGDLVFLGVVALWVAALTWLGAWSAGRVRRRRA